MVEPNGNSGSAAQDSSQLGGKTSFDIMNSFLEGAPANLDGMATALGLRVFDVDTFHYDEAGRIGRVFDSDQISYVIDINNRHSENRKRFALAHEISHYMATTGPLLNRQRALTRIPLLRTSSLPVRVDEAAVT